ncbi:fused DSP-PTPase phosphatase/NAD kinase-like protein [Legionella worsleiensis]|uniref:Tyrosine phosphatase II superfamily protein n=1 Tax=Legionella worsleiensis TaxID=45076 RepID=A0A0W1A5S4_9GAMM|nr:hypothetical protein [Legionella worsleiensis]KTD76711.1 tyrosine phosphatase II superfamily protein [Legionella worsleiensis]STY30491.1 tyrosine phosphatase II superfamily protein [Legionella worsleiensis]
MIFITQSMNTRLSKQSTYCCKKRTIGLWILFALLNTCSLNAKTSNTIPLLQIPQLPQGAFWIDNHWRNNPQTTQEKPFRWRSPQASRANDLTKQSGINTKGLERLFISGSAIPTLNNMTWLKKNYGGTHQVNIIDLRQETHLYLNGLPISIFYKKDQINWGKTFTKIKKEEQDWLNYLSRQNTLLINILGRPVSGFKVPVSPESIAIKNIHTEQETAQLAEINYYRIPVPDYHPPSPEHVDLFLSLLKKLPKQAWLHYHCAAGKGRTTTFMVMHDILVNGAEVSLNDIIIRQQRMGGINLLTSKDTLSEQPWKREYHLARVDFINLFYTYVTQGIYPNQEFSEWIRNQPEGSYTLLLKTDAYPKKRPLQNAKRLSKQEK